MYLTRIFLLIITLGFSKAKENICTPTPPDVPAPNPGNDVLGDDVPAITAALEECGKGGIIYLPSSNVYQIASPIDLSLCHNCTIQVDGTLNISTNGNSWGNQRVVFMLNDTSNDILVKGTGIIRDSLIKVPYGKKPAVMFNITSASRIHISGLTIRSPNVDFFRIRDSHDIKISSLFLSSSLDPNAPVVNSFNWSGFVIGGSSHIDISQTFVEGVVGCVVINDSADSISVSDLNCESGHDGVMVNVDGNYGNLTVSNLWFKNLTMNSSYVATGFLAMKGDLVAENVTWENVRVNGTNAAVYIGNCQGARCDELIGSQFHFRNVSFNNFEGQSKMIEDIACPLVEGGSCEVQLNEINVKQM